MRSRFGIAAIPLLFLPGIGLASPEISAPPRAAEGREHVSEALEDVADAALDEGFGFRDLSVGLGIVSPEIFVATAQDATGKTGTAGRAVAPCLQLGYRFGLPQSVFLSSLRLAFGGELLTRSDSDGGVARRELWLLAAAAREWGAVEFHLGVGADLTLYSGQGGTKVLNNGNSTDSYFIPSGSETTRRFVLNAGASILMPLKTELRGEMLVGGFASSRFYASALLTLGMGFDL